MKIDRLLREAKGYKVYAKCLASKGHVEEAISRAVVARDLLLEAKRLKSLGHKQNRLRLIKNKDWK